MKKILIIVGSLREGSFNKQLAEYIANSLKDRAEMDFLDWSDFPYMNQDIEVPAPKPVEKARRQVENADALWFVTPEYNRSIPGGLKNAIDWLSRPLEDGSQAVIIGKTATVSGVGGSACTRYVQAALIPVFDFLRIKVAPSCFTGICYTRAEFESSKLEITEFIKESIEHQAEVLLKDLDIGK